MSRHFQDEGAEGTIDGFDGDIWPPERTEPCAAVTTRSPEVALFLSMHCPRCGQLADLADEDTPTPCLLQIRPVHQYHLSGSHHEHNH